MWASQHTFKRLGRAMLYPIFHQQKGKSSVISPELELALRWWLSALATGFSECRVWRPVATKTVHMLVDARSTPPRIAAVLLVDGQKFYSDMAPDAEVGIDIEPAPTIMCANLQVLSHFKLRGDGQITSLELLSIGFGMPAPPCAHQWLCCGLCVRSVGFCRQGRWEKCAPPQRQHWCGVVDQTWSGEVMGPHVHSTWNMACRSAPWNGPLC